MQVSDIQALRQALQQLGAKKYKVLRRVVRGFNSKGRQDAVEMEVEVEAIVQPQSRNIKLDSNGNGEWITAEFLIVVVEPYYLCSDDIFITEYGRLKFVGDLNDNRYQGSMSGNAIREGSTGSYLRSQNNI